MSEQGKLERWHAVISDGSTVEGLASILHEDAVFHSPVVHSPQKGREIVIAYLSAAGKVLGGDDFQYVREIVDGNDIVLEFTTSLEGIHINGIDMIRFDDDGQIVDFKVMVRPLKAVNKIWDMMAAQLEAQRG